MKEGGHTEERPECNGEIGVEDVFASGALRAMVSVSELYVVVGGQRTLYQSLKPSFFWYSRW